VDALDLSFEIPRLQLLRGLLLLRASHGRLELGNCNKRTAGALVTAIARLELGRCAANGWLERGPLQQTGWRTRIGSGPM
jgi:hypothetical protein